MKISVTRLRKKMGVTQEKLAKILGVHRITISHWETGNNKPKKQHIDKMLKLRAKCA